MPILPTVGRRSFKIRLVVFAIYFILILGGVTMVYPFMVTVSSALSNEYDYEHRSPVPVWMWDEQTQYLKYIVEKYRLHRYPQFHILASAHSLPSELNSFLDISVAEDPIDRFFPEFQEFPKDRKRKERIYDDYLEFMKDYDPRNVTPLFYRYTMTDYQRFLRDKYERLYLEKHGLSRGDIGRRKLMFAALHLMNEMDGEGIFDRFEMVEFADFTNFPYHLQRWFLDMRRNRVHSYLEFLERRLESAPGQLQGPGMVIPVTGKRLWNQYLKNEGVPLSELNARWGTNYKSYFEVPFFTDRMPESPSLRADFEKFLQTKWPMRLIELRAPDAEDFHNYLRKRLGSVEKYNGLCKSDYSSFEEIPLPARAPKEPLERNFWMDYVKELPLSEKKILSAEAEYQAFLRKRYGSIDKVNEAYGTKWADFATIQFPFPIIDCADFWRNHRALYWRFLTFNFAEVIRFVTTRGRALPNTLILVTLVIAGTLLVNPLAAYALSRYRLKATQKILLFLLATMAFPAEVAMIPNFLLLRDLHLLNTFGALVLPGLANGFSIFLLKGFFDSLPPELYEAASIDGAGEWTMFWRITMPLCKPILAVLALQAFVVAYGGFLWALLVCQDEKMWTLMVWLYQFQLKYMTEYQMPYMVMAGFVIASIPTLLIFVFCQRIILRGIIIPTMK